MTIEEKHHKIKIALLNATIMAAKVPFTEFPTCLAFRLQEMFYMQEALRVAAIKCKKL